jgi:hypothetical protein
LQGRRPGHEGRGLSERQIRRRDEHGQHDDVDAEANDKRWVSLVHELFSVSPGLHPWGLCHHGGTRPGEPGIEAVCGITSNAYPGIMGIAPQKLGQHFVAGGQEFTFTGEPDRLTFQRLGWDRPAQVGVSLDVYIPQRIR